MGGESTKYILQKKTNSISIGRSSQNDISIRDLSCSKYHASMTYIPTSSYPGCYHVADLSSKHGTYINNRRVVASKKRDANIDEWLRKAEGSSTSAADFIHKLERKVKRLRKSKDEVVERTEDSILRVKDRLRIGRIECSLIPMESNIDGDNNVDDNYDYDDDGGGSGSEKKNKAILAVNDVHTSPDDNIVVIYEDNEEVTVSSDVDSQENMQGRKVGGGDTFRVIKQSANFKHWERNAHQIRHQRAISTVVESRPELDVSHQSVQDTVRVYEGLKRGSVEQTIKQGEFIDSLRNKSKGYNSVDDSVGGTIGLELLKKMGWDEKTSFGVSGKLANEPIHVVKRPRKAGLGSCRTDDSRILNAKANIGESREL